MYSDINNTLWQLEQDARSTFGEHKADSGTAHAVINKQRVDVKIVERYHNPAQRIMQNAQFSLNGKRMAFAKIVAALS